MSVFISYWQDYPDTLKLLHRNNVNMEALYNYAIEAAGWSTDLPKLDFMVRRVWSEVTRGVARIK